MSRCIEHPGPCTEPAVQALASRVVTIRGQLAAGQSLLQAFSKQMERLKAQAGVARLGAGPLFPAAHVLPALSTSVAHAVYYSERFDATDPLRLTEATLTLGMRDGQHWVHCHGRWLDADGQLRCGHLLPDETVLQADLAFELTLLIDATLEVSPDLHTNFSLFKPRPLPEPLTLSACMGVVQAGVLVRLAPNVDLCEGLVEAARSHGLMRARVQGGVGSTVGGSFADGRRIEPFVTELLIRSGEIDLTSTEQVQVDVDITLIDYTGAVTEGRLRVGDNPVLVTCECVLLPA